jgi:hypothetical protein
MKMKRRDLNSKTAIAVGGTGCLVADSAECGRNNDNANRRCLCGARRKEFMTASAAVLQPDRSGYLPPSNMVPHMISFLRETLAAPLGARAEPLAS